MEQAGCACPDLFVGTEIQHRTIDAPALARGRRAVLEDMALMQAADGAVAFGARDDHLEICFRGDHAFGRRRVRCLP